MAGRAGSWGGVPAAQYDGRQCAAVSHRVDRVSGLAERCSEIAEELERRVAALRRVPIFADLAETFLQRLAQMMGEVEVPAGHVLIEPRTKGSGMFVIEEGTVLVQARGTKRFEVGPGEVIGELALLMREGSRMARVQAKTPVRCLTLDRHSLQQALEEEPKLAIALLETAVERLAQLLPAR